MQMRKNERSIRIFIVQFQFDFIFQSEIDILDFRYYRIFDEYYRNAYILVIKVKVIKFKLYLKFKLMFYLNISY